MVGRMSGLENRPGGSGGVTTGDDVELKMGYGRLDTATGVARPALDGRVVPGAIAGAVPQDVEAKETEVAASLRRLSSASSEVRARVEKLRDMLGPVLVPTGPEKNGTTSPGRPSQSELAMRLDHEEALLEVCNEVLRDVMSRLAV